MIKTLTIFGAWIELQRKRDGIFPIGSSQTIVAIIDSGVDYSHPDLKENIWENPGEIPGNGIDDDSNGYVDDFHGYDFHDNDPDPMDEFNHQLFMSWWSSWKQWNWCRRGSMECKNNTSEVFRPGWQRKPFRCS
ncbi:MAG: S8 family serine peptidase [Bdellovibrionota bacterium]